MEKFQESKTYKPGEVSKQLGISPDLLRKYTEHFNIQTEWTKEGNKGHRRYTTHNVEELIAIVKKIQEQNWSWDQVLAWRNGEEEAFFKNHEERSILEKKIDQVLENQITDKEEREAFQKQLVAYIDAKVEERLENRLGEIMGDYLKQVESSNQLLLEETKKQVAAAQEPKKKWWQKLF